MLTSNWAQSETSIRVIRRTGLLSVAFQGLSRPRPFFKTFNAVYPDLSDCPWPVSEDDCKTNVFGNFQSEIFSKGRKYDQIGGPETLYLGNGSSELGVFGEYKHSIL